MFSKFFRSNQKTFGILALLVVVVLVTSFIDVRFRNQETLMNIARYTGLFGVLAIGAAIVIVTGGIDLSMGALIALTGVMFPMLLMEGTPFFNEPASVPVAFAVIVAVSLLVGLIHGLLITRLNLQPFLVTLCGLFIYRGIAKTIAKDQTQGFLDEFGGLKILAKGKLFAVEGGFSGIPYPFIFLLILAALASVFLHRTVWGRHLMALGRNEQAARFSGIPVDRMKIFAYMLCSLIAGLGGALFVMDTNAASPSSFGQSYELYAIAGAVLGGCSLRGGECLAAGVVCGAALVQVSSTAVLFLGVSDTSKFTVIGCFILAGVIADEMLRRLAARRRAMEKAV